MTPVFQEMAPSFFAPTTNTKEEEIGSARKK
jgi:hypothetical protein